ncbi:MAG: four helix bundle protein [Gammaproteobacteria bacterium]
MKFEDLVVWKRSAALSVETYQALTDLRGFGFRDQITRSGLSISSNIAEGFERNSDKETLNFLNHSKGSAGELRSQIYIGIKIGYLPPDKGHYWISEVTEISKMLYGLMQSIRNKIE